MKKLWEGRLFSVVEEEGKEIVVHPGSVAVVAVDRERRLVLVRQRREPARAELLELPAGVIDEGEQPLETARRELEEETGLHGGEWRELVGVWTSPGFLRERVTIFVAEGVEEGEPDTDPGEDVELVRWPLEEVRDRLGELEDVKSLAALLLYLDGRG